MPKAPQMTKEVVAISTLPNVPKQPETADGRLEDRMKTSDNDFFCSFWLFRYVRESADCYYFLRHLWSFGHRPLYTFQRSSKEKGIRGEFSTIEGERSFLLAIVQRKL